MGMVWKEMKMSILTDTSSELSCTSPQPEQYTAFCLSSQPITGAQLLLGFTDNTRHADLFQPDPVTMVSDSSAADYQSLTADVAEEEEGGCVGLGVCE
jgi:hypothetical protein